MENIKNREVLESPGEKIKSLKEEKEKITLETLSEIEKTKENKQETMEERQKQQETDLDGEISFDFSEIKQKTKKFFQKITESTEKETETNTVQEEHNNPKENNDEISLDFSKMKNIFKKNKPEETSEHSEDNLSLDLKKTAAVIKKNSKWIIPLTLILLAIFASTYFRIMPTYLPVTDDWAQNSVYSFHRNQIANQIEQQNPNLPEQNKNALVEKEFQKVLKEQKNTIDQQVTSASQQFKEKLQDNQGQTYLLAIDPYFWYAEARNYLNYGQIGDNYNEKGNRIFGLRNGRYGKEITAIPFHPVSTALLHKTITFFKNDASLMTTIFYLPAIIIALALIPAFFVGRKIGGNLSGFFAAILIALNSALLGRTPAGFSDTDAYNILFPLFIVWMFLESFEAQTTKRRIVFGCLGGFLSGLYAITWLGYWFVLYFIFATLIAYLLYHIINNVKKNKYNLIKYLTLNQTKEVLITGLSFFLSSSAFILLFGGFLKFKFLFEGPFKAIAIKQVAVKTIWPNVMTTVAEFNVSKISNIISQMGGSFFFWISLMGLVFLVFDKDHFRLKNLAYVIGSAIYYIIFLNFKHKVSHPITFIVILSIPILVGLIKTIHLKETKIRTKHVILLLLWLITTTYGFTRGFRFAILTVPAFALAFGACIGIFYTHLTQWISKTTHSRQIFSQILNKKITKILIIILLCILLISPLKAANQTAKNEIPSMNDAWYNSLTKIKDNTNDAIITSWWDFGHWFYSISERHVTFDGADQGERIHWVGKTLLSSDEKTSVGLLRMLNCGQEKPIHLLKTFISENNNDKEDSNNKRDNKSNNENTIQAVDLLNRMMVLNNKKEAIKLLNNEGFTNEQIAQLIKITYCDDLIEQFYITSEDMVGKAGVWGHFGSWDFERAQMHQTVTKNKAQGKQILIQQFSLPENKAENYHQQITTTPADQWVSPWPGYQGKTKCQQNNNLLECLLNLGQGTAKLEINLKTMEASIPSNNNAPPAHPDSFVYATREGIEEKKYNENIMGVSIVLLPESNKIMLTHPLQANSLFTKLFYFNGHGLKCFKKFDERQQVTGGKIQVWKVDFDCQQENKIFYLPQEEAKSAHLLISTQDKSEEEALQIITEIKNQITPDNFAEYAKQFSQDAGSKDNGGNLGWFGKNIMIPEFEQAAFSLEVGQISEPIQTQFGYHLILLLDKRET